mmetsp:Transcript_19327/g.46080  ORF Transcript_19327/g.46080 Transcript_19327/m.46080 type:complete len:234 (-) Transcript_19327:672-1373(-)
MHPAARTAAICPRPSSSASRMAGATSAATRPRVSSRAARTVMRTDRLLEYTAVFRSPPQVRSASSRTLGRTPQASAVSSRWFSVRSQPNRALTATALAKQSCGGDSPTVGSMTEPMSFAAAEKKPADAAPGPMGEPQISSTISCRCETSTVSALLRRVKPPRCCMSSRRAAPTSMGGSLASTLRDPSACSSTSQTSSSKQLPLILHSTAKSSWPASQTSSETVDAQPAAGCTA